MKRAMTFLLYQSRHHKFAHRALRPSVGDADDARRCGPVVWIADVVMAVSLQKVAASPDVVADPLRRRVFRHGPCNPITVLRSAGSACGMRVR